MRLKVDKKDAEWRRAFRFLERPGIDERRRSDRSPPRIPGSLGKPGGCELTRRIRSDREPSGAVCQPPRPSSHHGQSQCYREGSRLFFLPWGCVRKLSNRLTVYL